MYVKYASVEKLDSENIGKSGGQIPSRRRLGGSGGQTLTKGSPNESKRPNIW